MIKDVLMDKEQLYHWKLLVISQGTKNLKPKKTRGGGQFDPPLSPIYTSKFSLTNLPWQGKIAHVDGE